MCVRVCVFSLLPRDISQPPTFPAYNVTSSRALMIRVGNEAFRSFSLVFWTKFARRHERERAGERPVPSRANYSTSTPSMSAHRHTLEQGEHLLPLSSETRQTVQKGNVRLVYTRMSLGTSRWPGKSAKLHIWAQKSSGCFFPLFLSKFILLVVYVAHCPSDTIGQ